MSNLNNRYSKNANVPLSQSYYIEPRAYVSRDGQYLTLVLPGNILVRKHVNFFKKLLGVPLTFPPNWTTGKLSPTASCETV